MFHRLWISWSKGRIRQCFVFLNLLLFRLPTGALIISIQSLGGETARDRRRRECRELYELRLAEWWDVLESLNRVLSHIPADFHLNPCRPLVAHSPFASQGPLECSWQTSWLGIWAQPTRPVMTLKRSRNCSVYHRIRTELRTPADGHSSCLLKVGLHTTVGPNGSPHTTSTSEWNPVHFRSKRLLSGCVRACVCTHKASLNGLTNTWVWIFWIF